MRLTSVWTMARTEPTSNVMAAMANTIGCQSSWYWASPRWNTRRSPTKPATFTPEAIQATLGLGAPWYTSGAQKWNGTAATLNPKPTRRRADPARRSPLSRRTVWDR